jgi:hypothetical protein
MTETNYSLPREEVSLANWRESPQSQFSFHNVREFIGTQAVSKSSRPRNLNFQPLDSTDLASIVGQSDLDRWLSASDTDAFVIAKNGALVCDWRSKYYSSNQPHIVFSVSKSITGMLAGRFRTSDILIQQNVSRIICPRVTTAATPIAKFNIYSICRPKLTLTKTTSTNQVLLLPIALRLAGILRPPQQRRSKDLRHFYSG